MLDRLLRNRSKHRLGFPQVLPNSLCPFSIRWELSWGAEGWHICFDVLERLLAGEPIGRIVGAEAMKFGAGSG
jgi:hypothetical protein